LFGFKQRHQEYLQLKFNFFFMSSKFKNPLSTMFFRMLSFHW
jgi:hypothetical protein